MTCSSLPIAPMMSCYRNARTAATKLSIQRSAETLAAIGSGGALRKGKNFRRRRNGEGRARGWATQEDFYFLKTATSAVDLLMRKFEPAMGVTQSKPLPGGLPCEAGLYCPETYASAAHREGDQAPGRCAEEIGNHRGRL